VDGCSPSCCPLTFSAARADAKPDACDAFGISVAASAARPAHLRRGSAVQLCPHPAVSLTLRSSARHTRDRCCRERARVRVAALNRVGGLEPGHHDLLRGAGDGPLRRQGGGEHDRRQSGRTAPGVQPQLPRRASRRDLVRGRVLERRRSGHRAAGDRQRPRGGSDNADLVKRLRPLGQLIERRRLLGVQQRGQLRDRRDLHRVPVGVCQQQPALCPSVRRAGKPGGHLLHRIGRDLGHHDGERDRRLDVGLGGRKAPARGAHPPDRLHGHGRQQHRQSDHLSGRGHLSARRPGVPGLRRRRPRSGPARAR